MRPEADPEGGGRQRLDKWLFFARFAKSRSIAAALVEGGACVIVSTSELPELINLAARIYVMHEGRIVAELGDDERSEAQILPHYFGGPV